MRLSRRVAALGVIAGALALAGVGDHLLSPPTGRAGAGSLLSDAVSEAPASSAAWYCAGPLPIGSGTFTSSIVVANLSRHRLTGTVSVASTVGRTRSLMIDVPPTAARTVELPTTGTPGYAAVSVVMDGSGVGAEELIVGPTGIHAARCATHLRSAEYFAAGSTLGGRGLALALYDPGATPVVADVRFAVGTGSASSTTSAPAAFQGVPVGAGQLVVLDVGRQVPEHGLVATSVQATGGHLVAGLLLSAPRLGRTTTTSALLAGSPGKANSWVFGADPVGSRSPDVIAVFNPSRDSTVAHLTFGSSSGTSSTTLAVAAGGVATLEVPLQVTPMQWARVRAAHGSEIVVARTITVAPAPAAHAPERVGATAAHAHAAAIEHAAAAAAAQLAAAAGASTPPEKRAVSTAPVLAAGTSLGPGVAHAQRRWLLAGGASSARIGELVTVSNPGKVAATFSVLRLASGGTTTVGSPPLSGDAVPGPSGPIGPTKLAIPAERLVTLRVPAYSAVTVDLDFLLGEPGMLSLVVSASRPVLAGSILYARGSLGAAGFVSVGGIPVG